MKGMRSFIITMVLVVTVTASIGFYLTKNYKDSYLSEIKLDLNENVLEYTDWIESVINDIIVLIESHAVMLSSYDLTSSELAEHFKLINQKKGSISSIYFLSESDGSGVNSSGYLSITDIGVDLRQRPWYINAVKSTEVVISDVYRDVRKDKAVLTISYAVCNGTQLKGVLAVDVFLGTLYNELAGITTWRNTYNYYLDSQGSVILHPAEELLGVSLPNITVQQLEDMNIENENMSSTYQRIWNDYFSKLDKGFLEYTNRNNKVVYAVFNKIPTLQWTVVSAFDSTEIISNTMEYSLLVVLVSLLLIIFFGALLYYLLVWSYSKDPITRTDNTKMIQKIVRNRQNKEGACILLFIDLRNLSSINDKYGIRGGDLVLNKYSKTLQSLVKKHGNLITTKNMNFMVLFYNDDWNNAVELTNNMDRELNNLPLVLKDTELHLYTFLGLTTLNLDAKREIEQELEFVEKLFTEYKKSGADSPLICNNFNELSDQKNSEIELKDKLLKAVEEDRIVPFFQPIHDMKSGTVDKFEVLMRIQEGNSFLSPYPFIVIAEKYNLINTIDLIVIFKALDYKKSNDKNDVVELSINISGKSLRDETFIEKVLVRIDALNIKHSNITFEITETYNIYEMDKLIEIVRKYRNLGFKFSIDDFGTGFSSMNYIKHIPANYLKIDGSFIRDIDTNMESHHIVKSIISMAKAFNINTVAEFVERKEIMEMLKEMDIDFGQGYFFGIPEQHFSFIDNLLD
ncbi:MAG: EAL domain-containing protein [Dethiosulfatibacter sp.]|nr:EAL domain-containing protein [Dethiosulfatibacter sp.]